MKQKKARRTLTEALRQANPARPKKWAARESKRVLREARADAVAKVASTAEELAALPSDQLAVRIFRTG